MTQHTNTASGAADLPEALINIAREIEALKRDCGMDPESSIAVQNGRYMSLSYKVRALAAGQSTAAQQGAYAALPESFLEIPDVQDESGINAYYSREVVLECIDAALASHGQAPAAPKGGIDE